MNILITGATAGIGRQLALEYAKNGHKIFALGRNQLVLNELANNSLIIPLAADITSIDELMKAAQYVLSIAQHLDLVILNAGTCEYVDVNKFSALLFKRVMDINFIGAVNCLEVFLPLLKKSIQPHLVGVSSMSYYLPLSRAEAYGASKAALNYLFESLAIDLRQYNIDVTVVNPGFVKTALTQQNDFPMPFIIPVEEAARIIVNGIYKRKAEICFPSKLTIPMKLLSWLPRGLWRKLGCIFRK